MRQLINYMSFGTAFTCDTTPAGKILAAGGVTVLRKQLQVLIQLRRGKSPDSERVAHGVHIPQSVRS